MDPVTATVAAASLAAEFLNPLKTALELVPTGGRKSKAGRERRSQAYLNFQNAAHSAAVWPVWLGVLEGAIMNNELTFANSLPELSALRTDTSRLLSSLSEIRMIGNPESRQIAEEITMLLVELMESRVPASPPAGLRMQIVRAIYKRVAWDDAVKLVQNRFPAINGYSTRVKLLVDEGERARKAEKFNDCQAALRLWHKKFTMAARKDLGQGPKWWHRGKKPRTRRWQTWRPHEEWPGGWPPSTAERLISQARQEREARRLAPSDGKALDQPGSQGAAE
jgi:hypothetical protein